MPRTTTRRLAPWACCAHHSLKLHCRRGPGVGTGVVDALFPWAVHLPTSTPKPAAGTLEAWRKASGKGLSPSEDHVQDFILRGWLLV